MALQHSALRWASLAVFAASLGLVIAPARTDAFCADQGYRDDLLGEFPNLEIPVFLAVGGNSTVANSGVSKEDVARILIEVIARHNETVVAPKLVFGGFSNVELTPQTGSMPMANSVGSFSRGITVFGVSCDLLASGQVATPFLCNADTDDLLACAYQHINTNNEVIGVVGIVPAMCEFAANTTIEWSFADTDHDLHQTLQHEFGHILGLKHTNDVAAACPGIAGNDPVGNTGVMRTTNSAFLPLYRHWRRDDLDGLDFLWAHHAPAYEVIYWDDSSFPAAAAMSEVKSLAGMSAIRSPSLADAEQAGLQPIVTVDASRRVTFATLTAGGSVSEPPTPVDPGPLGTTVGSPAVAVGSDGADERVFVTWTADESFADETMSARWGLRDLAGGAWTHANAFELRTSRLTAGFDPTTQTWLIASLSLDSELSVSVLDYDGALLLEQESLGIAAYELGNPICGHDSSLCTMLFSDTELGGPNLARADFGVNIDPPAIDLVQSSYLGDQDVFGRLALARAGVEALRGVGGWYRFELGTDPEMGLDPVMPPASVLRQWPLTIGAKDGLHRLGYVAPVVCGDGYLQADEECDDGNELPGDGCDASCLLDGADSETGAETDSGATSDDGGVIVDDGCQCSSAAGDRRTVTTLLACLGLLALGGSLRRGRSGANAKV